MDFPRVGQRWRKFIFFNSKLGEQPYSTKNVLGKHLFLKWREAKPPLPPPFRHPQLEPVSFVTKPSHSRVPRSFELMTEWRWFSFGASVQPNSNPRRIEPGRLWRFDCLTKRSSWDLRHRLSMIAERNPSRRDWPRNNSLQQPLKHVAQRDVNDSLHQGSTYGLATYLTLKETLLTEDGFVAESTRVTERPG